MCIGSQESETRYPRWPLCLVFLYICERDTPSTHLHPPLTIWGAPNMSTNLSSAHLCTGATVRPELLHRYRDSSGPRKITEMHPHIEMLQATQKIHIHDGLMPAPTPLDLSLVTISTVFPRTDCKEIHVVGGSHLLSELKAHLY